MEPTSTRLNKYLSEAGYCSRRAADKLIDEGRVTINGVVPEMGTKVLEGDEVKVDGKTILNDAKKRTYQYYISTYKDAFSKDGSWYYHQNLDLDLMNQAAKLLLNHTDFQCFSKVNTDVNTFNCIISEAYWTQVNNQLIFTISADRFLRNMVRAIVGTLVNVGLHKITLSDFNSIIENKNRNEAGFSVPAQGLFLTKIEYDYL